MAPVGVSLRQFQQMQARLSAARQRRLPDPPLRRAAPAHLVILGVDCALRGTGYGVIRVAQPFPQTLTYGAIACPRAWPHTRCLVRIVRALRALIRRYRPGVCVVEGLFYAQNLKTALTMGEARGAALATVAEAGVDVYEIAPRKVKQAIVGYGGARKVAVAKMVQRLLNLPRVPAPDAADALALALTHAQEQGRFALHPPRRI